MHVRVERGKFGSPFKGQVNDPGEMDKIDLEYVPDGSTAHD